jgi:formylmethanofuran dehydrogenase subunit A
MENNEKRVPAPEEQGAKLPSSTEEGYMFDKMGKVEETEYNPPEISSSIHKEAFEEEPIKKPSFWQRYRKFIQ